MWNSVKSTPSATSRLNGRAASLEKRQHGDRDRRLWRRQLRKSQQRVQTSWLAALGLETPVPAPGTPLDDDTARRVIESRADRGRRADTASCSRRCHRPFARRNRTPMRRISRRLGRRTARLRDLPCGRRLSLPDQPRLLSSHVEQFLLSGQSGRLSAAALETLAVVAYRQPVSRTQIAAIRGVNVDGVMRTLEQRGLVAEVARDPGPGRAVLYGTTKLFLERLGIDSVEELAPLGQFAPDKETVEALEASLFAAST